MTVNSNNPFILPGLGQTGEMASNPLFASLEMMRQTFSTLSGANGLVKGLAMQPTLDPAELEKKINELKSVESWLKLNLSMLSSTIQGMEVQLATVTTLQQFMSANRDIAKQSWPNTSVDPSTPMGSAAPSAPSAHSAPSTPPVSSAPAASAQAQAAETQIPPTAKASSPHASNAEGAQAWWNMLTQQFGQLAAATAASMAEAPKSKTAEAATAAQAAKKEKPAGVKTAARTRNASKKPVTRSTAKK
jgi:hypothetical protein